MLVSMAKLAAVAVLVLCILSAPALRAEPAKTEGRVRFNRDIRPIMSDTCFRCHGPDKGTRMAGMRLDLRDEALKPTKSGVIPIVPGDPERSAIVQRVFAKDARLMPPAHAHKELSTEQKETIRRWVAEGAEYEGHWSYTSMKRPAVPEVAGKAAPLHNPIDAFIQERLAREGLTPSPEADRVTLIRRVTFDLTGLPPAPSDIEAFQKDRSAEAYEKLVDKLLGSPAYAEKQAMHWLDAVRYADTAGFHGDNAFPTWPYRDYVLRAFRDNMPFDRFTREQLAGDLLPGATREQRVASAFNRLTRTSAEGGLQPKEYLSKYAGDRVRTLSSVWLGATMGCAECHDHKFDPILARDFYSMEAFFADIAERGLVRDKGPEAWGAKLTLPSAEQQKRLTELDRLIEEADCELTNKAEAQYKQQEDWERRILALHAAGELAWQYQRPISAKASKGATLTIYNDEPVESNFYTGSLNPESKRAPGLVVASGANPETEVYTVSFKPGAGTWTALGFDIWQDESLPAVRLARGSDRLVITEVEAEISSAGTAARPVPFVLAVTTGFGETDEHPPMAAIDGKPETGWGISHSETENPFLALRLKQPLQTEAESVVTLRLKQESGYRKATIGRFRVALAKSEYAWPEGGDARVKLRASRKNPTEDATLAIAAERGLPLLVAEALALPSTERSRAQRAAVLQHFIRTDAAFTPFVQRLTELRTERSLLNAAIPQVMVSESVEPRQMRLLPRGNWMDESGEIVEPAVPVFLGKLETGGARATRLDLANWIVSPENPLTARVTANRVWRQFFGAGLSRVLDDLGSQGEWPTHTELLDWLAAEFVKPEWEAAQTQAWDMRHLIRTIVLSHAYRQSSAPSPQLLAVDPDNRLFARQSRFRLDAEMVRDTALAISGLLTTSFGGPSVRPYQPEGYLSAMNFPKRDYAASQGADQYRRGVYTHWQRTFLHPSLLTFDAPTREECTVNRVNSNTPLQALVLLNDPVFVEAARVFAQNILKEGGRTAQQRIDWAYRRALGRAPAPAERKVLASLHRRSLQHFRKDPGAARDFTTVGDAAPASTAKAADLAAMTTVARAILNLHETITRN